MVALHVVSATRQIRVDRTTALCGEESLAQAIRSDRAEHLGHGHVGTKPLDEPSAPVSPVVPAGFAADAHLVERVRRESESAAILTPMASRSPDHRCEAGRWLGLPCIPISYNLAVAGRTATCRRGAPGPHH